MHFGIFGVRVLFFEVWVFGFETHAEGKTGIECRGNGAKGER